jgi:hypothetical protein
MDWIKVEDRLPEPYQRVLIGGVSVRGDKMYSVGRIQESEEFGTEWWYNGGNDYESVNNSWVKFWMPLPELPKEERYDDE